MGPRQGSRWPQKAQGRGGLGLALGWLSPRSYATVARLGLRPGKKCQRKAYIWHGEVKAKYEMFSPSLAGQWDMVNFLGRFGTGRQKRHIPKSHLQEGIQAPYSSLMHPSQRAYLLFLDKEFSLLNTHSNTIYD